VNCRSKATSFSYQKFQTIIFREIFANKLFSVVLRQQNMVATPTGLGAENDCAGEVQQQIVND
jgi:hypothetical protein